MNLTVTAGEVVAIVGRNGVGKTTLLELITGRARRTGGRILLGGQPIHELPTYERARMGLGYVPQAREVFPSSHRRRKSRRGARHGPWTLNRVFDLFQPLAKRRHSLGLQLSGGEQQMLSIARALVGNPSVLIMDEPTEGLAPIIVEAMIEAIEKLTLQREMAILLVEQVVDVALHLSHRCAVMDRGAIVHLGLSDDLRDDGTLMQGLMGFSSEIG